MGFSLKLRSLADIDLYLEENMGCIIGLDIGYSNLRVAVAASKQADSIREILLPAGADRTNTLPLQIKQVAATENPILVNVDDEPWVAGLHHSMLEQSVRPLHEGYPESPFYRALIHCALLMTGHS